MAHVIHRFDMGGMENGLVNLINFMPKESYRHAIVCVDEYTDFHRRLKRDDVELVAIRKKPGQDPGAYRRLYRAFRSLKPRIVHTRNLAGLDGLLPAVLAGAPCRLHGEHGRDIDDPDGSNRKNRFLRRMHRPMVDHYTTVSRDLDNYLQRAIGVPEKRISQIYNGVDTGRFRPRPAQETTTHEVRERFGQAAIIVGTVGRCQRIKDQASLVEAFIQLVRRDPAFRERLRLAVVGDGPERDRLVARLAEENLLDLAWLPGSRGDIAEIMRSIDIFVLPSLSEGISNTILEAMASGLPVVATRVGGNSELVLHDETGLLVPVGDLAALTEAIAAYSSDRDRRLAHARNARSRTESTFSMASMVRGYEAAYSAVSGRKLRL